MNVSIKAIEEISCKILREVGVPEDDINIIVDSIIYAHMSNKGTHGIGRIPIYIRKIREGLMTAKTRLNILNDTSVISLIDAQHGFGQVAAYKGMQIAIDKALLNGIGVVGIKSSNNFGTAGYFVDLAAKENMIGLIFSNSSPAIAAPGGNKPIFGTNPIGIAFPGGENRPNVVFDMATSNVARGKIRLAATNNENIPLDWALDANGNPTTDPFEALKGSMVPIGGHKGYGLSLIVDVLAGLLTGASFGGDVKPLNHKNKLSNYGHLIIVINISYFQELSSFITKMELLTNNVKISGDSKEIFLPGERGFIFKEKSLGVVNVPDEQVKDINSLAKSFGLAEIISSAN